MSQTTTPLRSTIPCGTLTTPFGAVENPKNREQWTKIPGTHRVDLLVALRSVWGNNITRNRGTLYKLVAGKADDNELHSLLKYFYLRHPAFCNYVSSAYYFGNQDVSLIRRIISPARERILNYQNACLDAAYDAGVGVLGYDMDYLYLSGPIAREGCEVVAC